MAVATGFMAFWGVAGAIGLAGGGIDMGATVEDRFPFGPVVAGIALLLAVAVPMAAATWALWRGSPYGLSLALLAGLVLVGWIVVEVLFIRTFTWLQPVCLVYGVLVAWVAWRAGGRLREPAAAAR